MTRKENEKDKRKIRRRSLIRLALALFLLLMSGGMMLLFQRKPEWFFPGYRNFSKLLMKGIAAVTGLVPFSLWDIGALLLIILFLVSLVIVLVKKYSLFSWISGVVLTISILGSFAVNGWMLNHYAPKLSDEIGLEVRKYSEEELFLATKYYLKKASEYARLQERDADGQLVRQDFNALAVRAGKVYESLSGRCPFFDGGSYARVKKLSITGKFFLSRGISGIYMPITAESSIPALDAAADIPYTMAHECAHRLGIASEEEANFAAFLACEASEDPYFQYSGYYNAYLYCRSKLLKADPGWKEKLAEEIEKLGEGAALLHADVRASAAWYRQFEKEQAVKQMEKVNDTYLRTFSQEEGVKSYGEVVNDLLAWFLSEHAEEEIGTADSALKTAQ